MHMKFRFFPLIFLLVWQLSAMAGSEEIIKQTKRISLVFVGKTKGLSESSFGHVALRMALGEKYSLSDATIEFVAKIPENEWPLKKYIRGAGIFPYEVSAEVQPFYQYQKIKTIQEDRDLTIVDLDLSQDEIQRAIDYIVHFLRKQTPENYTFFYKNCSFFALKALEKAIGRDLSYKSFPWMSPKVMKTVGIAKEQDEVSRASHKRARYAQKALDKDQIGNYFTSPIWVNNFVSNLKSKNFHIRQSSYIKLLSLLASAKTPEQTKRRVRSLIRFLKIHENEAHQFAIKNLFRKPEKKVVLALPPHHFHTMLPYDDTRLNHQLTVKDDKVFLEISWKKWVKKGKKRQYVRSRVFVPIDELKYTPEDKSITHAGMHVGSYIKNQKLDIVLSQNLDYGLDFKRNKKTVSAFIYIDKTQDLKVKNYNYSELKELGKLNLNNKRDFQGSGGTCYAMALIQKALVERASFLPDNPKNDKIGQLQVLDNILAGKFAFIPGYKNISEFTSSIAKEEFKNFVQKYQHTLNKNPMVQLYLNFKYSKELEINKDTLPTVKAMVREGVIVPMIIGMTEKNTRKLVSSSGHIVLIHAITQEADGSHRLLVYDPNTTIHSLFTLDQDFKLKGSYLSKDYDFYAGIQLLEEEAVQLDHAVRSRQYKLGEIKLRTREGTPLLISPLNVLTTLK